VVEPERDRLPRALGTWSATAVVVGSIIGSGIFRVPATVAAETGSVGAFASLWVLGGVIALCGALSLAELGAAFPRAGGMYVFLREAYGPRMAFLFGWGMLVVNPVSYAAVAVIFAAALDTLVGLSDSAARWVAAGMMVVLVAANYRSVRVGAAIQNASTASKVIALLGLAMAAFVLGPGESGALAGSIDIAPRSWSGYGIALIAVLFAYDAWQWLPQLAGEMRDPGRTVPRALGGGLLIVILVYLATNAANLHVLSLDELAASPLVTADVAGRVLGAIGGSFVAGLIMIATFSSNNGGLMTDPRVFFAMAEDGLFFRSVAAVHPRYRTPHVAVVVTGLVAIVYIFLRTFEQLAEALIIGMWPFLALSVGAVLLLRVRRPDLVRPYRTPGYPLVPIFFLLATVGIFGNALVEHPLSTLVNLGILAAGLPVYYLWRRGGG
jgi:amino acid transporter